MHALPVTCFVGAETGVMMLINLDHAARELKAGAGLRPKLCAYRSDADFPKVANLHLRWPSFRRWPP
jgi:hypothetical protein